MKGENNFSYNLVFEAIGSKKNVKNNFKKICSQRCGSMFYWLSHWQWYFVGEIQGNPSIIHQVKTKRNVQIFCLYLKIQTRSIFLTMCLRSEDCQKLLKPDKFGLLANNVTG